MEWEHPSDQSGRYDINEQTVSLLANASKQIVTADPDCVFLLLGNTSGNPFYISTKSPVTLNAGMPLAPNSANNSLVMDFASWGKLVQVDWFAIGVMAGAIWSLQLLLRRGPRQHVADFWTDYDNAKNGIKPAAGQSADLIDRMARAIAATSGHYFERASDQSLLGSIRRSGGARPGNHDATGDESAQAAVRRGWGLDRPADDGY